MWRVGLGSHNYRSSPPSRGHDPDMDQPHDQKGVFQVYRRLMGYAVPHWPRYLVAMLGMAIYAFTQAAFATLLKPLTDKGFVLHDMNSIRYLPLEVMGLFLLR